MPSFSHLKHNAHKISASPASSKDVKELAKIVQQLCAEMERVEKTADEAMSKLIALSVIESA